MLYAQVIGIHGTFTCRMSKNCRSDINEMSSRFYTKVMYVLFRCCSYFSFVAITNVQHEIKHTKNEEVYRSYQKRTTQKQHKKIFCSTVLIVNRCNNKP